ncbi:metalloregulator ArsR/SmtB family transcription factor [Microbulbifer thermotolerans]|uniref:Metalloregulator ArsR/SmtB family transcription factor n=1 Tax=Microbulbifer thermotolerans TaxID=252514 RepID=A0A143HQY2_MICTH|nr:metalloregulator ArsR/SmtB family transcription factor [Microbulbifer thermotolerans]AMX04143.1 transcriptional regulator [Microbulbifer thermotolerans]MCX2779722.1 metalloregulator ArsR/SmtB family transcription factor [Microbulbifer thermotolerans]MCX2782346.1 metalloregulator ArsR/SmtB family transcription factor [Microbulbifer thermotolerans]MCX2794935.1 metalloregulator ArsR/SmtB family transcription factor [Microbulbifer thermotolerans]MCX2800499.1 metalloregulator ArsR/SmtB family tr
MNPLTFYKCLGDETRLRCLLLIAHEGELCVCELTEALAVSQPKVSRHLAQLRSCGLLRDRRQGQWIFYRLEPALPSWVTSVLNQTLDANRTFIRDNLRSLSLMVDRPNRCCDTG